MGGKENCKHSFGWNSRITLCLFMAVSFIFLATITIVGSGLQEQALATDFTRKNIGPCREYLFGTDWMGRDMFLRTLAGLSVSIRIGGLTALTSAVIAFLLGKMCIRDRCNICLTNLQKYEMSAG